ncbi:MAG: hypothetical protein CME26_13950 [Gemmatimonadetes bacterium]|nr:hypothetical protein [Gemmatimonadota bacterium]
MTRLELRPLPASISSSSKPRLSRPLRRSFSCADVFSAFLLVWLVTIPQSIVAQGQVPVEIRLPEITAEPGETILVPVTVSDLTGLGVLSSNLVIGYDARVVQSARVLYQGTLTEGWSHAERTLTPASQDSVGLMSIGVFTVESPAIGAGTFVYLEMTVDESALGESSPIVFDSAILNDRSPQAVALDGHLTIRASTPGDFNLDGNVDFTDFLQFAEHFGEGEADEGFDPRFDIDGNGQVGFEDFLVFASGFGQ